MPVLTFANTKGGAGKTTAALVLASELSARGIRVTMLDADPSGWLTRWYQKQAVTPFLTVQPVCDETIEETTVKAKKAGGYVLIDLPSSGETVLARAVALADRVLVPVQGCAMDAQGGAEVLDLLNELDTRCNVKIAHSVVLTRVNAAVTTRALHAAKDFLNGRGIETMTTPITERAAYRDVFDKGGLIHDLDPTEVSNLSRALDNASRFADEVLDLVPQRALLRRPSAAVPLRPAA